MSVYIYIYIYIYTHTYTHVSELTSDGGPRLLGTDLQQVRYIWMYVYIYIYIFIYVFMTSVAAVSLPKGRPR